MLVRERQRIVIRGFETQPMCCNKQVSGKFNAGVTAEGGRSLKAVKTIPYDAHRLPCVKLFRALVIPAHGCNANGAVIE